MAGLLCEPRCSRGRLRALGGVPAMLLAAPARPATHSGAARRVTLGWTIRHTGLAVQEDAMATLTCPGCGAAVSHDDLICFTCGTDLPRRSPVQEETTPPTVMQEYLRADGGTPSKQTPATGPISPVVLRLSFPAGNVDVPAGTSLVLGRDPGESLVAAAFANYENVSRRHATITVSDTGHATIRDEYSTNGTYVNDDRVLPGTDVRIGDGDQVRLAADVTAEVSLPGQQGFSTNGHHSSG